jgi:acyl carrier protein
VEDRLLRLAECVIEGLNLEELKPEDIDPEAPLFGEGLGLDSIDALELAVLLERHYGVRIQEGDEGRAAFASLAALDRYLQASTPS